MKKRLVCSLLLAGLLLAGCGAQESNHGNDTAVNQIDSVETDVNSSAPESTYDASTDEEAYILTFEATTTDGEAFASDYFAQSKLTMINVWATYCNPCLAEMPDLGEIASSYDSAEFQIIGIVSDVAEESDVADVEYAKELITQTQANYPHLLLNESLYRNLVGAVEAVPTTFFVNQKGEPLGYVVGAQSKEVWEEIINELLAEVQ